MNNKDLIARMEKREEELRRSAEALLAVSLEAAEGTKQVAEVMAEAIIELRQPPKPSPLAEPATLPVPRLYSYRLVSEYRLPPYTIPATGYVLAWSGTKAIELLTNRVGSGVEVNLVHHSFADGPLILRAVE